MEEDALAMRTATAVASIAGVLQTDAATIPVGVDAAKTLK